MVTNLLDVMDTIIDEEDSSLEKDTKLLRVPFIKQDTNNYCGPATVLAILQ